MAGVCGLVGVIGTIAELAQRSTGETVKGLQASIILLVITLGLGVPPLIWDIPEPLSEILRSIAFVFALILVIGVGIELSTLFSAQDRSLSRQRREERGTRRTLLDVSIGLLSLATAVLGLVAAVIKH